MTAEKSIKGAMKEGKLLIGSKSVIKAVKAGRVGSVIFASNCPAGLMKDMEHYSKTLGLELTELDEDSVRLGEVCGKPFNVLLVGIIK